MDKLLKEAIADAKTVRETALANAKLALEEAFAPKLQSMLAAKLNEEDDEMEAKDDEDLAETHYSEKPQSDWTQADWDAYYTSLEEADKAEWGKLVTKLKDPEAFASFKKAYGLKEEDEEEAPAEKEEEEMEETFDLDSIIAELEGESEEEPKKEPKEEAKGEDEEEVDLKELLAALQEGDDEEEDMKEAKGEDEEEKEKMDEISKLRSELNDYRETVVFLKDKINEINLLNAKLLYTNKLFKNHSLTESQKVKILESLDRTKTVREVKLVYSTLAESLNEMNSSKKKITESLGFASKKTSGTTKTILEEGNTLASRLQTLANINVNKKK